MNKIIITPYDVVTRTELSEVSVDHIPIDGDPLEINGEMYYVCEQKSIIPADPPVIGVIPLVVRNPKQVQNIKEYVQCLSIAHRKVIFKNEKGTCNLDNCDEMIIS